MAFVVFVQQNGLHLSFLLEELVCFSRAVLSGGSQTLEVPAVINLRGPLVQLLLTAHSLPYFFPASQLRDKL